jgi:hypothetical protein
MAINKELWVAEVKDQLFEGAEWIRRSTNHDAYVNNAIVHVPNAGSLPAVQVNPSVFPLTISQRTDNDLTYSLKQIGTEPTLIQDWEAFQISYDKQSSVLRQHAGIINDMVALEAAYAWAVSGATDAARIIRTSGANGTTLAPGATGTRKKLTYADITKAAERLDRDKVGRTGRILVLDTGMYWELFSDTNLIQSDVMGRVTLPEGVINRLAGFDIYLYNAPVVYNNASDPVKKAIGAATASTDNLAGLFFQADTVSNALGAINVYSDENKPEYYGSVFSAMVLHAAQVIRTDRAGVGAIVQIA